MTIKKESTIPSSKAPASADKNNISVDLQPIQEASKSPHISFSPLSLIAVGALLTSILIIWFLLTAKSAVIIITPEQANVSVHGGLSFQLADHYLIRPGKYTIKASAAGYIDMEDDFTVNEDDHTVIKLSMEKKPGLLSLTTNPQNSVIHVDGNLIGTTPLGALTLSPGEHFLNIKAPRYISETITLDIKGLGRRQDLHVNLRPNWGYIEFNSSPKGADISINGKSAGKTPFVAPIISSGDIVEITYPGYKVWRKKLSINAGETLKMPEIKLVLADGILNLITTPPGATITIGGKYRGNTPATIYVDAEKKHSLSVFLNGYFTQKHTISLESGKRKSFSFELDPNIGTIKVLASPQDSMVWIDNKLLGTASESFDLPSHPHLLEVKRSGFVSYKKMITPQPQLEHIVRVKLLTKEEAYWASIPTETTSPGSQILKLFRPKDVFMMGAPRQEAGRRANEVLRKVKITRPFYLAVKEVTNKQYWKYKQHSSRHFNGVTLDLPNQPVVNVSWEQAALYCNWLSKKAKITPFYIENKGKITGFNANTIGYRLPSEAEWAWAALSPKSNTQNDSLLNKNGNIADISAASILGETLPLYDDGHPVTAAVGSFNPNQKGLYDLQGNAAEWVNDYYGIRFNLNNKIEVDPMGPENAELKTIRGSSWRHSDITQLRLSFRDTGIDPRDDVGFRVARYVKLDK